MSECPAQLEPGDPSCPYAGAACPVHGYVDEHRSWRKDVLLARIELEIAAAQYYRAIKAGREPLEQIEALERAAMAYGKAVT